MAKIFSDLDGQSFPSEVRHDVSVNTIKLEKEMRKYNGNVDLAKVSTTWSNDPEFLTDYAPYVWGLKGALSDEGILAIADKYPNINAPNAMMVESVEDLQKHMLVAYQVMHFYYLRAKRFNSDYPNSWCGRAGRNNAVRLMDIGYPNAMYVYDAPDDHGYVLLPFVLREGDKKGSLLLDPTSDQLTYKEKVRNQIMIKLGSEWTYETDWNYGADLFPNRICSIDVIKRLKGKLNSHSQFNLGGKENLDLAFSNLVRVDLDKILSNEFL